MLQQNGAKYAILLSNHESHLRIEISVYTGNINITNMYLILLQ